MKEAFHVSNFQIRHGGNGGRGQTGFFRFDSIRIRENMKTSLADYLREQIFIRKIYLIKSFDIQSLISRFLNFENFAIQLDNLCISQSRYPNGRSSELSCIEILRIVSSNAIERRKNSRKFVKDRYFHERNREILFVS